MTSIRINARLRPDMDSLPHRKQETGVCNTCVLERISASSNVQARPRFHCIASA